MSHTPGPWEVAAAEEKPDRIILGPNPHHVGKRMTLAEVYGFTEAENAEANARLIAAAPQLLEALRNMLKGATQIKNDDNARVFDYEEARAAIAAVEED